MPTAPGSPGSSGASASSGSSATTAAELSAIAEGVDRYRERAAALGVGHLGTPREDLVAAIYEAERALRSAQRLLTRAAKVAETGR